MKRATRAGAKLPPSERSGAILALLLGTGGARQLGLTFWHGLFSKIDLVGVVNQAIQDGVGQRRITDHSAPLPNAQ